MGEESKEAIGSEDSSSKKVSLVEMAEVAMSQSMLIFLLADLRILSSTGNIRTKFESLCLDNDHFPRLAARDFAGYVRDGETHGVTAAHIMAVLILEITREAEEVKAGNRNLRASVLMGGDSQRAFALKWDAKAASNLPSLLHCYNEMVFDDITTETHLVRKADYPMDRFASDAASEDLHRADFDPDVEDQNDEGIQLVPSMIASLKVPTAGPLRSSVLRRKVTTKKVNAALVGFASTQNALLQHVSANGGTNTECYSQSELVQLMERAIEKRDNESDL